MVRRMRGNGRQGARAYLRVILLLGLLGMAAFLPGGPARGQTPTGTTTTTTTPSPFCSTMVTDVLTATCSFTTTTAVAPGATLVLSIISPSGATITGVSGLPAESATGVPGGCTVRGTPATGLFTPTVIIVCDLTSSGIPVGTTITETVALPSLTSTLTETVTYNASAFGAIATGTPPTTTRGTCAAGPAPNTFLCTNTTGAPTAAGATLSLTITAPRDATVSVEGPCGPNTAPCFAGTCPLTTPLTSATTSTTGTTTTTAGAAQTITSPSSGILTLTYTCTSGETVPAGTTLPVLVTVNPGLGTQGGGGVTEAGICTATPPPGFTCTNVTPVLTVAGGSLALTFTAAPGQTITIVSPCAGTNTTSTPNTVPCIVGTCPLTTPLPAGPATTVTVTYTCASGQSVTAQTTVTAMVTNASATTGGTSTGTCVAVAVPPPDFECTNTTSAATMAGATLTLAITAAPGQIISVAGPCGPTTAPCTAGTCPLNTPLPAGPTTAGGTLAITYTCGTGESVPAGTTIMIGVNAVPTPFPTAGTCGLLAAMMGATAMCTNMTGATTVSGGTLTLAITAALGGQTIQIMSSADLPPMVGSCPLTTPAPGGFPYPSTPISGTLTVTYTCGAGQSVPTGTPVTITVTNANGVAGMPTEGTTANANGVAGTPTETTTANGTGTGAAPTELTTVNAPGVGPGVPPTTGPTTEATTANASGATLGVPGPTQQTITFVVCPPPASGTTTAAECGQRPTVTLTSSAKDTDVQQLVTFTATATTLNTNATITSFLFNFGDGYPPVSATPTSSGATASVTVTHTFPTNGVYLVTVQAIDSSSQVGSTSLTEGVRPTVSYLGLYQPPPPELARAGTSMSVTLTATPVSTLPGETVTFSYTAATQVNEALAYGFTQPSSNASASPTSLSLDFGDGTPPQLVVPNKTVMHAYASPGQYLPTLTATDNLGNTGHASTPETVRSPVVQPPTMVAFTLAPTDGTTGTPVTFEAGNAQTTAYCNLIKSYSFDFGDGTPPVTPPNTGQVASHTYTAAGTYTVTLTATGCDSGTASTTAVITISDSSG